MSTFNSATFGANIKSARLSAGFSQSSLARRSRVNRTQIVKMEAGVYIPQIGEVIQLAEALDVPIQSFLTGNTRPWVGPKGIAIELRHLGVRDLVVSGATVPGAFRRPEEVLVLAVRGERPSVRVIEAIPFVLSRCPLKIPLVLAFASYYDGRAKARLAWLGEITLLLAQRGTLTLTEGVESGLGRMAGVVKKPTTSDDLGHPGNGPRPPVWKRWNITYGGGIAEFRARVEALVAASTGGEE